MPPACITHMALAVAGAKLAGKLSAPVMKKVRDELQNSERSKV